MKKVDSKWTLQLLRIIDSEGTNLTKSEIDFVADLIDNIITEFTPQESRMISQIHRRRVINGVPEEDD